MPIRHAKKYNHCAHPECCPLFDCRFFIFNSPLRTTRRDIRRAEAKGDDAFRRSVNKILSVKLQSALSKYGNN